MAAKGLIGALIGGVIGAVIWAAVAFFAHVEISWVAIGVGALVGFGSLATGGKGHANGLMCGGVAVAAIFGGKFGALTMDLRDTSELRDAWVAELSTHDYEEELEDARDFADIRSDLAAYPSFMVEHRYTDAVTTRELESGEVDDFRRYTAPHLIWIDESQPTFEEWKVRKTESIDEFLDSARTTSGIWELVKEGLGFIDILFFFFGVLTAWKIGLAGED